MLPSIMSKPKEKDKDKDKEAKKTEKENKKAKKDGKKGKKGGKANAQEKEGIFRKSGSEKRLIELSAEIGDGDYMLGEDEDDHVVATILKRFLRDMKGPLVLFDLYNTFIGADAFDGEERVQNIQQALKLLPEHHLRILETIMRYLNEVSQSAAQNFMTASNLAIVFAPNLLRPKVETPLTLISDASHVTSLVASLIADCDVYFPRVALAPTASPSVSALTPSSSMNRDEFKKTMNIKYVAHQTLSLSLVAQMAKEAHLTDEEMQAKLKVIGSRIKKGDKKAVGMLFSDEADHEGSIGGSKLSPHRSQDPSPLGSPRRVTVEGNEDNKRATSDLNTAMSADGRKMSKPTSARGINTGCKKVIKVEELKRIPKSLDLFGSSSSTSQLEGLSASTPLAVSSSQNPHALLAKSPSTSSVPPISSSPTPPSAPVITTSPSSSQLSASTPTNSQTRERSNAKPSRTREHRREGHSDLSKFLKEILHNNELVEAAAAAEAKESQTEKAALAETQVSDEDDEEGES